MKLRDDIGVLKGVGAKRKEAFQNVGLNTINDLLHYYPKNYENRKNIISLNQLQESNNKKVTVFCEIISNPKIVKTTKNLLIVSFRVQEQISKGIIEVVFFNNFYVKKKFNVSQKYYFYGKIVSQKSRLKIINPEFANEKNREDFLKIYSIYPKINKVPNKLLIKLIREIIEQELKFKVDIPEKIRKEYKLIALKEKYIYLHNPQSLIEIKAAYKRLRFEESIKISTGIKYLKKKKEEQTNNYNIISNKIIDDFILSLPFTLTKGQNEIVEIVINKIQRKELLNCLIQGDVGSGKTVVAVIIAYLFALNGYQCVYMAPTEILAKQHLKSFRKFIIDSKINVDLLVSNLNTKEKKNIKEKVASNVTNIIIGTHAILQEDVKFNNVGLIITDEQHRFGVKQRSRLFNKSENPNTIVMSATPIPRTLSLVLYGDLDILYLKDKPSGRKRINTYCLNNNYFYRVADFIEQQVKNGMQGYIVCPYINSEDQFLSVEVVEKELSKKYKNINFGILHGKMNTDEKEIALEKFLENEINVLICTTIIEVGIDVPNSTVMLILGGERFGLSQLHQLRGRVGRGCKESNCFVLYNSTNEKTKKRMDVFKSCNNGFEIAEEDLKLRGSGDYLGLRQHGSNFAKYLDLIKDYNVIIESNDIAKRIFESDTEEDIAYRKQLIRQFENDMKEIVFN